MGYEKSKHKILSIGNKVYSVAIKCYMEQLPYGWEATKQAIQSANKKDFQIIAIWHNRDEVTNGVWAVALEKPHLHILVKCTNSQKRIRIYQILDMLHIYYRPTIDDTLLSNHALETINDFQNYTVYLTHETPNAIKDNKELYDISEYISNLTINEIKQVRDGYLRLSETPTKATPSMLAELDQQAFTLGYELKNFTDWYVSLPFNIRSNAKMKTIKESYTLGVDKRIEEHQELNRLCIFIKGAPNIGKTYAAKQALAGKRILPVSGGGTGKFDNLRVDTEALIFDDEICPNLLNMADNYICRAYKRNNNNPAWTGKYFVVTSNLSFSEWLSQCGIKIYDKYGYPSAHYKAMLSRFYLCVLTLTNEGTYKLSCTNVSDRGTKKDQKERIKMFEDFRAKYNATISQYTPNDNYVDYTSVLNIDEVGCLATEVR